MRKYYRDEKHKSVKSVMQCNTLIMSDNIFKNISVDGANVAYMLIRISTLRKYFPSWCIYEITSAVSKLNKMVRILMIPSKNIKNCILYVANMQTIISIHNNIL